jgi:hypothetical protein
MRHRKISFGFYEWKEADGRQYETVCFPHKLQFRPTAGTRSGEIVKIVSAFVLDYTALFLNSLTNGLI